MSSKSTRNVEFEVAVMTDLLRRDIYLGNQGATSDAEADECEKMFCMEILLVRMSKIRERMKKDKETWRYVLSKIEALYWKEINSVN